MLEYKSKMSCDTLHIQNYSEKSIVLLGDTKPHKESIKALGGRWNCMLRKSDHEAEESPYYKGWIFPVSKKDAILAWIDQGCSPILPAEPPDSSANSAQEPQPKSVIAPTELTRLYQRLDLLETKLDRILEHLQQLSM